MCGEFAAQAENVRPNPGRAPGRTARVLSRQAADTLGVAVPSREQGPTKYDTLTVRPARRDDGTSHGRCGMHCRLMGNEKASKLHVQTLKLFYSPADEQERLLRFTCHADHLHLRRPYSQLRTLPLNHAGRIGRASSRSARCAWLQAGEPPPVSRTADGGRTDRREGSPPRGFILCYVEKPNVHLACNVHMACYMQHARRCRGQLSRPAGVL